MIKRTEINEDVVTMARKRIINAFANGLNVEFSISGGKDSICLADLIYKLCIAGEIDKSRLVVDFIDEEAIYDDVEAIVKEWRLKFLQIGVKFNWWCIEVKHFNCFNTLTQEESFICWDRYKQDVWVRKKPPFALGNPPELKARKENYQSFLPRLRNGCIKMVGLRVSESLMRLKAIAAATKNSEMFVYPIYDWNDADVWRYIRDNNLEFPKTYIYLYQTGLSRPQMRISQFFSVDTAKSLVKMNEYYPDLFDRICKREPNAYMAMLYFDTELYRRSKKGRTEKDTTDYKKKTLDLLENEANFDTTEKQRLRRTIQNCILRFGMLFDQKRWKDAYNILVGGDPKNRAYRALMNHIYEKHAKKEYENGIEKRHS